MAFDCASRASRMRYSVDCQSREEPAPVIAAETKRKTAVPDASMAETLQLGHASRVSYCLRVRGDGEPAEQHASDLEFRAHFTN